MELDITEFFNTAAPMDYSASVAEIGRDAGPDTWRAANDDALDYSALLDTPEKRAAFIAHLRDMGFSDGEEMAEWPTLKLVALFMQLIAGDMREAGLDADSTLDDWAHYEADASEGVVAGRIFKGDVPGNAGFGRIFYYLGS